MFEGIPQKMAFFLEEEAGGVPCTILGVIAVMYFLLVQAAPLLLAICKIMWQVRRKMWRVVVKCVVMMLCVVMMWCCS